MSKTLAYKAQAVLLGAAFFLLSLLPPRLASRVGGWLINTLSPLFAKQNTLIEKHLQLFLPEKNAAERRAIRKNLWRHIGMMLGEYPHLEKALNGHKDFKFDIRGFENITPPPGKAALFASAHIGNWEMLPLLTAMHGQPFHAVFRPPNNPYAAKLLAKVRAANGRLPAGFEKGRNGLREISAALKNGTNVGMLVDQRHSGGIKIPFFGREVDSTSVPADVARKYGAVIIPGRVIRTGPCAFTLEALPAMNIEGRDSAAVMGDLHALFEKWIREYPEQWLWMHRRWGKNL